MPSMSFVCSVAWLVILRDVSFEIRIIEKKKHCKAAFQYSVSIRVIAALSFPL